MNFDVFFKKGEIDVKNTKKTYAQLYKKYLKETNKNKRIAEAMARNAMLTMLTMTPEAKYDYIKKELE